RSVDSTALKPALAAASKRSRKASSVNRKLRLAAKRGIGAPRVFVSQLQGKAAAGDDRGAGHIGRLVGGEVDGGIGDLLGGAEPTHPLAGDEQFRGPFVLSRAAGSP